MSGVGPPSLARHSCEPLRALQYGAYPALPPDAVGTLYLKRQVGTVAVPTPVPSVKIEKTGVEEVEKWIRNLVLPCLSADVTEAWPILPYSRISSPATHAFVIMPVVYGLPLRGSSQY